ncbi:MAG: thioredoxin [Sandaracinus sp.]|nr:thioredoxin [Sandaracinus sp.]|tara:strand:- start:315 stop:689 length:375 start_codon:yes stop_codon:yes gene_type:complete
MSTIEADETNLKESIEADGITLVDFWAEWCGPCKMFGPIFETVSEKHEDIRFLKVDTEAQPGIAQAFQIQSIPTLMLFRDNVLLFRQAGALPEAALESVIEQAKALDMDEVRAEIEKEKAASDS